MPTLSRPANEPQPVAPAISADGGRPDQPEPGVLATEPTDTGKEVDLAYWLQCMDDAERAERDWRKRGREVVEIYRNERVAGGAKAKSTAGTTFNILYANTEVLLGAIYQRPPQPVVRSRFVSARPVPIMPQPPMIPPAAPGMGPMPPSFAPPPDAAGGAGVSVGIPPAPPVAGVGPPPGGPPTAGPPGPLPPSPPPNGAAPVGPMAAPPPPIGPGMPPIGVPPPPEPQPGMPPAPGMPAPPVGAPGGMPSLNPPAGPQQDDIETAASVIEKALEIIVDDEHSNEAIKTAIKDVLLPGRGVCRVRWLPEMKTQALPGGPLPDGTAPTTQIKIWEEVNDEYIYWEDILLDPVRQAKDCDWIGFRHLFTEQALIDEFKGEPAFDAVTANGKVKELLLWTDESAAKNVIGGGSAIKTSDKMGNYRRKAMVWEVWDRVTRQIIWLIRDGSGIVLRVDPDSLQLDGFFPIPIPMLAVTTSDSRIPRTYYDLYAKLAANLDALSSRIAKLQDKIKVRGAYNSASKDIADILTADDGKMLPVAGVDMLNGGLNNHIWLLPIAEWIQALQQLYMAQDNIKNSIYEIMGISDIMRGATKATETATAQRIKGSMGVSRLEDMKGIASNFVRDMLRLKTEIICKNFDTETLAVMTGEEITPEVEKILRSDFLRTCTVDIEADSTVVPDESAEQESMSMIFGAIGTILQGAQGMLMTGIMPPPMIIQLTLELIKMALHPIRYSRGVVELINGYQTQLEQIIASGVPMGPPPGPPPGGPPPGIHGPPGGPPRGGHAHPPNLPPGGPGGPPRPNGAGAPPVPGMPPTPM